jgi:hypothetical protein
MQRKFCLSLFLIVASGCVTIPNSKFCTVAGVLSAGANCAESLTEKTSEMTLDQFIDFLEPQSERDDPDHPGQKLPARGGAICQSSDDFTKIKTSLEKACRELGSRCSYEVQHAIESLNEIKM